MEIKVHFLNCGQVKVDRFLPINEKVSNPFSYTGIARPVKYQVSVPVSTYLIEHPKGMVLIDTSWNTENQNTDQNKIHNSFFHWLTHKAALSFEEAVDKQLTKIGYKSSDIDYLIPSLTSDHSIGLNYVKEAKKIMISDVQWKDQTAEKSICYEPEIWNNTNVQQYSFLNTGIGPEGLSYDLFDDGSVVLVSTSKSNSGVVTRIVENNGKFMEIAGRII
ncbi:hypothetical protein GKZ90_0015720 [Flavobacterium sp. MC2016-06]|uniref:N-acyl homoserine lactonase family protein n=1 Tax=Flavobacterium sp. MC2016-06 TaxID=2676308 RepID=UPI0012BA6888|nr:N-acyl homoserine lactonase family protein [Flavobacterium sp. MC2016-06]MBU3860320.1 hypothetical protein [Flavobacterium sp. MC2016-06]